MWKKLLFWVLAIIITLSTAVYQRMTGPTYPKSFEYQLGEQTYSFKLPRSQNGITDALISIEVPDTMAFGEVYYKKFKTGEEFVTVKMHQENDVLVAWLPKQPAAGKLEYGVKIYDSGNETIFETPENIVIRFKGNVPPYVLIPHILLIFIAMLLSNLTGFYAISKQKSYKLYTLLTLIFLLAGGMLMGPVLQKFAFGEFWTGFPFGMDLTDNKTLFAFVLWLVAWFGNRKQDRRYLVIIAAVMNLLISLIPHSMFGSELDYATGEINTGMITVMNYLF
ncbi:MAG: hypothetical protein K9H12_03905 [Bacteroidales bacterium]|nr:hypothetical protein [Bacteroidales bacterium]